MLKFGDKDIPSLFYGSVPVIKAYYGTEQVWPNLPYDAEIEFIRICNPPGVSLCSTLGLVVNDNNWAFEADCLISYAS